VNTVVDHERGRPLSASLHSLRPKKKPKSRTLLTRATPRLVLLVVRLRQVNIPRHTVRRAKRRRAGLRRRRLGFLLAPQRRRIDDALDDIDERLHYAYGCLCGSLNEQTSRALSERRALCSWHLP
jgi:hypothetical protein